MNKALITTVKQGKLKGEFRFKLIARNGEIIATSETYKNKKDILTLIKTHFAQFLIEDTTIIKKK